MTSRKAVVIGAGIGGLAAAVDLSRKDFDVAVIEKEATIGGKMRQVRVDGAPIDGGPTVFTMRWVFESLFEDAGQDISDYLRLTPLDCLARHAWRQGGQLDLFADVEKSADAIGKFAGSKEARGFQEFCARSADIYRTLKDSFIAGQRPSPFELMRRVGRLDALWRTAPFSTLWSALGDHFDDPRLRQLFGRYATYVGSSPMQAPATLMLIAHVEQDGVWSVEGGMHAVAQALASLADKQGAFIRTSTGALRIETDRGRVSGVVLDNGDVLAADVIVFNGDASALGAGLLGEDVIPAAPAMARKARSLSAITWCLNTPTHGFPLEFHNVFFAEDYKSEFDAVFQQRAVTDAPTVYICAQDRRPGASVADGESERLLMLVNAPADGDENTFTRSFLDRVEKDAFALLAACGLIMDPAGGTITSPEGFNTLFPATGGALYGRANHGSMASFGRSGAASRIPGLYLAGGSVHPGAGVPMAATSGRLAAARIIADLGS